MSRRAGVNRPRSTTMPPASSRMPWRSRTSRSIAHSAAQSRSASPPPLRIKGASSRPSRTSPAASNCVCPRLLGPSRSSATTAVRVFIVEAGAIGRSAFRRRPVPGASSGKATAASDDTGTPACRSAASTGSGGALTSGPSEAHPLITSAAASSTGAEIERIERMGGDCIAPSALHSRRLYARDKHSSGRKQQMGDVPMTTPPPRA